MLLAAIEVLFFEFSPHLLKVEVNIEILKKAAVTKFPQEGAVGWYSCADPVGADVDVDVGDCSKMCD